MIVTQVFFYVGSVYALVYDLLRVSEVHFVVVSCVAVRGQSSDAVLCCKFINNTKARVFTTVFIDENVGDF